MSGFAVVRALCTVVGDEHVLAGLKRGALTRQGWAVQLAAHEFRLGALDGLEFLLRSVGHQLVATEQ